MKLGQDRERTSRENQVSFPAWKATLRVLISVALNGSSGKEFTSRLEVFFQARRFFFVAKSGFTLSTFSRVLADVSMYGTPHCLARFSASSNDTLRRSPRSHLLPTSKNEMLSSFFTRRICSLFRSNERKQAVKRCSAPWALNRASVSRSTDGKRGSVMLHDQTKRSA